MNEHHLHNAAPPALEHPASHEASAGHSSPASAHAGHAAGHDRHAGHSVSMFRDKFWLSLALTIPSCC